MVSGYDMSSRVPFRLMKGRLGIFDKHPLNLEENSVQGVEMQYKRAQTAGGNTQQERMIKDKRRSLDRATLYSYQGAKVIKTDAADREAVPALINPNALKPDYDDKVISVGYEYNFKVGTVFEWVGTNTFWIIYLQDLTETAYFRGDVRRCSYQIAWEDESGIHSTYVALKGPSETRLNSMQRHGVTMDLPNYSLSLLMPKNEDTLNYFKRYSKFYLQGSDTCWRVEAIDEFSSSGILEVYAMEYYANETEDDIENGIVGGLVEEIQDPNPEEASIEGDTFIKMKRTYTYTFPGRAAADWSVGKDCPVEVAVNPNNNKEVYIRWTASYSGQFDLYYGDYKKTIVVESLF